MSAVQRGNLSRRDFLRGLSAVGVGTLLAACAPAGAPATGGEGGGSQEPVVIQHWVFWNQPGKVKDLFEQSESLKAALNGNQWEFRTGVSADAGLTAVAGGTPPDIGIILNYLDYMIKGQVIALDDYIAKSSVIQKDKFIEGNWNVCQYQGNMYGIPAYECFVRRGLNYNETMVADAGLDPANPPQTWDELFAWHEKLTQFDSAGNLIRLGIDPYDAEGGVGPGNDGWFLCESWGFTYFDEDTKEFNLDDERMAQGLEVMGEFVKLVGPDNLVGFRGVEGQGTWGGAYEAEVQAMIIEGYWHPGEVYNNKPEVAKVNRASWAPVPEERRGTKLQFGGGHMAQIFKDAKHKDEAWPLAEWFQSTEFCDIIFTNIGWLPAYKSYFEQVDVSNYPGLQFYLDSITEANEWGPFIRCEIQNFVATKYAEAREKVYRGEMTGEQAAAWLQEQAVNEYQQAGYA